MNRVLTIFALCVGMASPCAAYLDPGTGSALFQVAYLLLLGALAFAKRFWASLKRLLGPSEPPEESTTAEEPQDEVVER